MLFHVYFRIFGIIREYVVISGIFPNIPQFPNNNGIGVIGHVITLISVCYVSLEKPGSFRCFSSLNVSFGTFVNIPTIPNINGKRKLIVILGT